jgi:hypothetical protein
VPLCSTVIGGGAPSSFLDFTEGNSGQVVGGSELEIGPGESRPVQRAKMMAVGESGLGVRFQWSRHAILQTIQSQDQW